MPAFDYPLEKLKTYMGQSPCPADFDVYWTEALEEMKAVDAQPERVAASFSTAFADCYEFYFAGVGGARVHAKLVVPKSVPKGGCPAIVQFHGYSGSSTEWSGLLTMAASGFVMAALDCRGQAGESQEIVSANLSTFKGHIIRGLRNGPKHLAFRSIFLDAAQLAGLVMDMPEVDATRVASQGGSQGGALSLACAALEPRIAKVVAQYPFLSDYYRVWQMDLAENAYDELRAFFRQVDPLHEKEEETFNTLGYIDVKNLAPRIKGNTLMAITLMDKICPPSTQFAAYNNIHAPKRHIIYYDYGHEGLPNWSDHAYDFYRDWM
ncbi:acetylxylan esterase [Cerasicoccus arenae]|uniref:Acetylxylan esterase n=1 Tax=Cerasicoccus arenae TaxID=424488 RepID=A0A8J3GFH1_9BACT|nr:acetylxylan esterase [Cerasicoccus arenae]MBK1858529.1 acetylxylan esterase [Cerasicoccus arenae]GHC06120.1 acetylxylan esterase [Cerasicoccus arenae]